MADIFSNRRALSAVKRFKVMLDVVECLKVCGRNDTACQLVLEHPRGDTLDEDGRGHRL